MSVRVFLLHSSGAHVWIELSSVDMVDLTVKRLLAAGWRAPDAPVGAGAGEWPKGPDGKSPLCLKHGGIMMSLRQSKGDEWHSHKLVHPQTGIDLYCRGYPHGPKDKDGFYVAL